MELKLTQGQYAPAQNGGHLTVTGAHELGQRIVMKLTARRGGFAPLPGYGSRLHELLRVRAAERESAARLFVHEALEEERGLTLERMEVTQPDENGTIDMDLWFRADGAALRVAITV